MRDKVYISDFESNDQKADAPRIDTHQPDERRPLLYDKDDRPLYRDNTIKVQR